MLFVKKYKFVNLFKKYRDYVIIYIKRVAFVTCFIFPSDYRSIL